MLVSRNCIRHLQQSNSTGSNEEESAEAGGSSSVASRGNDSRTGGFGRPGGNRDNWDANGAVGAGPGGGVAGAGSTDSGGDIDGIGDDGSLGGGCVVAVGGAGGGGRSRSGTLKAARDTVGGGARGEIHIVGAAPSLLLRVVGAVVAIVAGVCLVLVSNTEYGYFRGRHQPGNSF